MQGKWKQQTAQDTRHVILKHQIQNLKQQILQQRKQATLLQFEMEQLLQEQQEQQEQICLARNQIDTLQQSNLLYNTFIRNSKLFSSILQEYSNLFAESVPQASSRNNFLQQHIPSLVNQLVEDFQSNEMQFLQQGTFGTKNSLPILLSQILKQQPSIPPANEFIRNLSQFVKEAVLQIQNEQVISFEEFVKKQQQDSQQFIIQDFQSLLQTKQTKHLQQFLDTQSNLSKIQSLQREFESIQPSLPLSNNQLLTTKYFEYFSLQQQLHTTKQILQFVTQQETLYIQKRNEVREKQQQIKLKMKRLETVQIRSEQKRQWIQQLVLTNMNLKKGFHSKQTQILQLVQEKIVQQLIPTILDLTLQLQHSILNEVHSYSSVISKQKKYSVIERQDEWIEKLYQICKLAPSKSIQELLETIYEIVKQDYKAVVLLEEEIRNKNRITLQHNTTKQKHNIVDFVEWEQLEIENANNLLPKIKECINICREAVEKGVKQVQVVQFEWAHQPAKGINL